MPPPARSPIRVLYVDNDPAVTTLAKEFLEEEGSGYTVLTANSAEEGLELLESECIDCVVSDYDMPRMDGLAFLEAVRAEWPDLPFILITVMGSEDIASEAISMGVSDYLKKDAGREHYVHLQRRIQNAVERRRAQRETERRLTALETAREGICIVGTDGNYSYANDSFLDMHGYDEETLLGQPWELLHPNEEVDRLQSEVLDDLGADDEWEGESVGLRADGSTFQQSVAMTGLEDGRVVAVANRNALSSSDELSVETDQS